MLNRHASFVLHLYKLRGFASEKNYLQKTWKILHFCDEKDFLERNVLTFV